MEGIEGEDKAGLRAVMLISDHYYNARPKSYKNAENAEMKLRAILHQWVRVAH